MFDAYFSKPFTQPFGVVMQYIVLFPTVEVLIFGMSWTEKTEKRGTVLQFWATKKFKTEKKRFLFSLYDP